MPAKLTTEEFIKRAKEVHGDKYDYSKVEYINSSTKVCIICPIHGEFWQVPFSHLRGIGCEWCGGHGRLTFSEFIKKGTKVHDGKYDYSKVEYINASTKVCIICPEHGEFWQKPVYHVSGRGCPICGGNQKFTTEKFIEKARKIKGDKYDYSKVNYVNAHTKVCIICPIHGEFWQEPDNHYRFGCQCCKRSSLEESVKDFLEKENIVYEEQKRFDWLFYAKSMSLDFYIPEFNAAIECQGEQHFRPYRFKNGKSDEINFKIRRNRDILKQYLCQSNGVKLYYYVSSNMPEELNEYRTYKDLNELLNNIKNNVYDYIEFYRINQ